MSPRIAWIVLASLALPSLSFAQAEEEVVAIRARLDAAAGGDASRIIFAKDAGGRVTHYVYRDLGATDRIVRKIE
jgi:hypothetical protein